MVHRSSLWSINDINLSYEDKIGDDSTKGKRQKQYKRKKNANHEKKESSHSLGSELRSFPQELYTCGVVCVCV